GESGYRAFYTDQSGVIRYQTSPGGEKRALDGSEPSSPAPASAPAPRQVVRTGSMTLIVSQPDETLARVQALAERLGGYVEASQLGGQRSSLPFAEVTIRIPAAQYAEARRQIRVLGQSVEDEHDDARDVTGPYVDMAATLRNYHAEEAQYLEIMRRAG